MKNTVFQSNTLSTLAFLLFLTCHVFAQKKRNLYIDVYPVFIQPQSTDVGTNIALGGGFGADMMLGKWHKDKLKFTYGLGISHFWAKEKGIELSWPTNPEGSKYERKYSFMDIEPKLDLTYLIKSGRTAILPSAAIGYSWFWGSENYQIVEGEGENLKEHVGSMGGSFNLHAGLGLFFSTKNGKSIGIHPEYIYRLNAIKPEYYFLGTDNFHPHAIAFRINFMGLLFGKKTVAESKQ